MVNLWNKMVSHVIGEKQKIVLNPTGSVSQQSPVVEDKPTERIPEDILVKINELQKRNSDLRREFYQVSMTLGRVYAYHQELIKKMDDCNAQTKQKIQYAGDKLKLTHKLDYEWQFDGIDSFVGTKKPTPKQPEQK